MAATIAGHHAQQAAERTITDMAQTTVTAVHFVPVFLSVA